MDPLPIIASREGAIVGKAYSLMQKHMERMHIYIYRLKTKMKMEMVVALFPSATHNVKPLPICGAVEGRSWEGHLYTAHANCHASHTALRIFPEGIAE